MYDVGGKRGRGYYKAIETGKLYGPIDSNEPLVDTPAVVLFNRICPPCERAINDWLVRKESALLGAVDRVAMNHIMTVEDKIDIARLLALHASQYPDLFGILSISTGTMRQCFMTCTCFLLMLLSTHICDGAVFLRIPASRQQSLKLCMQFPITNAT